MKESSFSIIGSSKIKNTTEKAAKWIFLFCGFIAIAAVVGIQATTIVAQVVLVVAIARGSRPPVAVGASIVERAIDVVPTKDRRESGGVASNAAHLIKSREPPAPRADVVGSIDSAGSLTVSSGGCGTEVIIAAIRGVTTNRYLRSSIRIVITCQRGAGE